jgi:Lanthionine synthetase C-like protein
VLYEPERHEPLLDIAWDETRARRVIQSIVRDTELARDASGSWPSHPLDDEGDAPRSRYKSLYLGSAGLLWSLWYLQRAGAASLTFDPARAIEGVVAAYRADPDTGSVVPSFFLGEVGVLLVAWRMTQLAAIADQIYNAVEANIPNPTNEALWAAPGTMLAAWHLWDATGEHRWRELFLANVEQVWNTCSFDAKAGCHLWTQDLYGKVLQYLGAGHGFVGNAYALLKGASVLDADRQRELHDRCVATLRATRAVDDAGGVNWPPVAVTSRPGQTKMLVQWCHGAPGVVTAMAPFPRRVSPELDAMLVDAGNLVWKAGPLAKGYGLCHGTAGNGYALLALHERTGDSRWLARARAFAMHAMEQQTQMRERHGRGRHTLWTGDAGLALYLWHCIEGSAGFPTLDFV